MPDESESVSNPSTPSVRRRFFQRADWISFGLTTLIALVVYGWTLAPDVGLDMAAMNATSAFYAGVAPPPGFPVWTVYAWLFTELLPFSNIAWRVNVSSAVAASATSGLIALLVSFGGGSLLRNRSVAAIDAAKVRTVCGVVAGLVFAFQNGFWRLAVTASTLPFAMMLFAITLTLLMKWFFTPAGRRWLWAAYLFLGLTFTSHQLILAAAFGLQCVVMCRSRALCRDFSFANGVLFFMGLLANHFGWLQVLNSFGSKTNLLRFLFLGVGIASIGTSAALVWRTRRLLTEWKSVLGAGLMFLAGLLPHLYLPVAAMTTPPSHWGYARTVEGFMHLITRGQFERLNPTCGFDRFFVQLQMTGEVILRNLGWPAVVAALLSLGFLRQTRPRVRRWLLGLLALLLSLWVLVTVALNPPLDRQALEQIGPYFASTNLIVSILAGYGMILFAARLAEPQGGTAAKHFDADVESSGGGLPVQNR